MTPVACLILPYFGTLPEWFPEFLLTCGHNPRFRWLIYSDSPGEHEPPPNVLITRISFADYRQLAGKHLGISLSAMTPYKLTDLKPFLGAIHAVELGTVRYWGFGDMDVLYGDLWRFVRDPVSRGAAIVSMHDRRVSGHFCLLQNTETMRSRCFSIAGWQDRLQQQEHVSFDEWQFSNQLFLLQRLFGRWYAFKWYRLARSAGLGGLLDRSIHAREAYTTPLSDIPWPDGSRYWDQPCEWEWREGRVLSTRDGQEIPYLHFMNYKSSKWLSENIRRAVDQGYRPHPPAGFRFDTAPWEGLDRVVHERVPKGGTPVRMRIGLSGILVE